MTEEEYKLEYEQQMASVPPLVRMELERLRDRSFAQEIVISWILAQIQKIPGLPRDHALRFLCRQANQLEDGSDGDRYAEFVALLDELRSHLGEFERPQ